MRGEEGEGEGGKFTCFGLSSWGGRFSFIRITWGGPYPGPPKNGVGLSDSPVQRGCLQTQMLLLGACQQHIASSRQPPRKGHHEKPAFLLAGSPEGGAELVQRILV